MQITRKNLPEITTSVLKYAIVAAVFTTSIGSIAALIGINADARENQPNSQQQHCGYSFARSSAQVTVPAPEGDGWLSIDAFEVTNAQFQQFVEATGYKTVAEKPWTGVDPVTGTRLGSPPGSAVFMQPQSVTDAAFKQWWAFVEGASWRQPTGKASDLANKDHYPVVQLALDDVQAYAAWAGRRLLTAGEWEHAARYNEDSNRQIWHKADSSPADVLSTTGSSESTSGTTQESRLWLANTWQGIFPLRDKARDGYEGIAPVGCYEPLASGLHDMIGNVWEWVQPQGDEQLEQRVQRIVSSDASESSNTRGSDQLSSRNQVAATTGAPMGNFHGEVNSATSSRIMGGSFLCSANFCMNYHPGAYYYQDATLGTNHIGFRTVVDIAAPD